MPTLPMKVAGKSVPGRHPSSAVSKLIPKDTPVPRHMCDQGGTRLRGSHTGCDASQNGGWSLSGAAENALRDTDG